MLISMNMGTKDVSLLEESSAQHSDLHVQEPSTPVDIPAPPPPPPPNLNNCMIPGSPILRFDTKQRSRLRNFNWEAIPPEKVKGKPSLWSSELFHEDLQIDTRRMEELFGKPEEDKKRNSLLVRRTMSLGDSHLNKVFLLDSRRSMNISIFLKQFKRSAAQIVEDIRKGKAEEYSSEKLSELLKQLPERDEIKRLQAFKGDRSRLSEADLFMLLLLELPSYTLRLEALILKKDFHANLVSQLSTARELKGAAEELLQCSELHAILKLVLKAGNFMNAGGYAGNAMGFRISSLLKLAETKANKPGMNLLHFVVMEVQSKNAGLLSFTDRLEHVSSASRLSEVGLLEEFNKLQSRVTSMRQALKASEQKDLREQMGKFIEYTEDQLLEVQKEIKALQKARQQLVEFLCEEEETFCLEECCKVFSCFCQKFQLAIKENQDREREDKRRLQWEKERLQKRHSMATYSSSENRTVEDDLELTLERNLRSLTRSPSLRFCRMRSSGSFSPTSTIPELIQRDKSEEDWDQKNANQMREVSERLLKQQMEYKKSKNVHILSTTIYMNTETTHQASATSQPPSIGKSGHTSSPLSEEPVFEIPKQSIDHHGLQRQAASLPIATADTSGESQPESDKDTQCVTQPELKPANRLQPQPLVSSPNVILPQYELESANQPNSQITHEATKHSDLVLPLPSATYMPEINMLGTVGKLRDQDISGVSQTQPETGNLRQSQPKSDTNVLLINGPEYEKPNQTKIQNSQDDSRQLCLETENIRESLPGSPRESIKQSSAQIVPSAQGPEESHLESTSEACRQCPTKTDPTIVSQANCESPNEVKRQPLTQSGSLNKRPLLLQNVMDTSTSLKFKPVPANRRRSLPQSATEPPRLPVSRRQSVPQCATERTSPLTIAPEPTLVSQPEPNISSQSQHEKKTDSLKQMPSQSGSRVKSKPVVHPVMQQNSLDQTKPEVIVESLSQSESRCPEPSCKQSELEAQGQSAAHAELEPAEDPIQPGNETPKQLLVQPLTRNVKQTQCQPVAKVLKQLVGKQRMSKQLQAQPGVQKSQPAAETVNHSVARSKPESIKYTLIRTSSVNTRTTVMESLPNKQQGKPTKAQPSTTQEKMTEIQDETSKTVKPRDSESKPLAKGQKPIHTVGKRDPPNPCSKWKRELHNTPDRGGSGGKGDLKSESSSAATVSNSVEHKREDNQKNVSMGRSGSPIAKILKSSDPGLGNKKVFAQKDAAPTPLQGPGGMKQTTSSPKLAQKETRDIKVPSRTSSPNPGSVKMTPDKVAWNAKEKNDTAHVYSNEGSKVAERKYRSFLTSKSYIPAPQKSLQLPWHNLESTRESVWVPHVGPSRTNAVARMAFRVIRQEFSTSIHRGLRSQHLDNLPVWR
ncbi:hypothetical protein XENTR_v10020806 [Xenopus tropicalis]|uniref:FH2 domain-containing protein 1 n=1 Tax=Xenopus tropicalis TaxID=8364 RepID=A0A6I8RXM1_XENTR|nr:FH2 domain-containing protein 1 [Xenopus tropicalis]KAE8584053.1 hypothetical protein XENTR_v10020806 [Xenopus tropicalis]